MIKIEFWLKKSDTNQESLEYITISAPKIDRTVRPKEVNYYICEVYLSTKAKNYPIYGINPIDAFRLAASEFARTYFQALVKQGYVISEVESKKP
jgi:hypothetical protein